MRKLIRDKLDKVIPDNELEFVSGTQYDEMLRDKLQEELAELIDTQYTDVDEFADVIEVLYALAELNNITKHEIQSKRIEKLYERGGFRKGLVLNRLTK